MKHGLFGYKQSQKHIDNIVKSRKLYTLRKWGIQEEDRIYLRRFREIRNCAEARDIDFILTIPEFKEFWNKPCSYCGKEIMTIGLDRVDNELGYMIENVVSCCKICNYMKRGLSKEEFLEHIKRINNNLHE